MLLHNQGDGEFVDEAPEYGSNRRLRRDRRVGRLRRRRLPILFVPYYPTSLPIGAFLYHNDVMAVSSTSARRRRRAGRRAREPETGSAAAAIGTAMATSISTAQSSVQNDEAPTSRRHRRGRLPRTFDEGAMFVDYDNDAISTVRAVARRRSPLSPRGDRFEPGAPSAIRRMAARRRSAVGDNWRRRHDAISISCTSAAPSRPS